jgi:hypothetical protein
VPENGCVQIEYPALGQLHRSRRRDDLRRPVG